MYQGAGTAGVDGLISAVMVGGAVYIGVIIAVFALNVLLWYAVIKAGVRNGVTEALKRAGIDGHTGGTAYLQGYPPAQEYGAPPAPHAGG